MLFFNTVYSKHRSHILVSLTSYWHILVHFKFKHKIYLIETILNGSLRVDDPLYVLCALSSSLSQENTKLLMKTIIHPMVQPRAAQTELD